MQAVGDDRGGLSRRGFLGMSGAAAISAAASTLLASCSSSGGASNHGPVDLLVWYWGEQEAPGMKNFMQKAVAKYNSSQSKVQVQAVLQSSDSLYSAFAAVAQALARVPTSSTSGAGRRRSATCGSATVRH